MSGQAYWLFALVAWPAAAWGAVEIGLRTVTGYGDGLGRTVLLTAAAAGTIALCSWRRKALAAERAV